MLDLIVRELVLKYHKQIRHDGRACCEELRVQCFWQLLVQLTELLNQLLWRHGGTGIIWVMAMAHGGLLFTGLCRQPGTETVV